MLDPAINTLVVKCIRNCIHRLDLVMLLGNVEATFRVARIAMQPQESAVLHDRELYRLS
jgi:hypothetical protein